MNSKRAMTKFKKKSNLKKEKEKLRKKQKKNIHYIKIHFINSFIILIMILAINNIKNSL